MVGCALEFFVTRGGAAGNGRDDKLMEMQKEEEAKQGMILKDAMAEAHKQMVSIQRAGGPGHGVAEISRHVVHSVRDLSSRLVQPCCRARLNEA